MLREAAQAGHILWREGDGQQAAFVWAEPWLGKVIEPDREYHELVGRYLTSYGPVAASDLASWLGVTVAAARRLMAKHLVEQVQVEGETESTFMKPDDLEALLRTRKSRAKGLAVVPPGDPFRLAYKTRYTAGEEDTEDVGLVFLDGRLTAKWSLNRDSARILEVESEAREKVEKAIQQVLDRAGLDTRLEA